jgi:hypothetical protein
MIRRFTSAQFVHADAGSKDKNPMGSTLLSTPIIAPTNLDRHQILRNFCHDSVRKGLSLRDEGVEFTGAPISSGKYYQRTNLAT